MTFMLKKRSMKNMKIEIFNASEFEHLCMKTYANTAVRYRLRVGGRWFYGKNKYGERQDLFTWYEIRDLIWRSVKRP